MPGLSLMIIDCGWLLRARIIWAFSMLLYSVLGSLYLGEDFRPHISDLSMAF